MTAFRVAHVINGFSLGGVPQVAYQILASLPPGRYQPFLYLLRHHGEGEEPRPGLAQRLLDMGVTVRSPVRDDKKFFVVGELCRWLRADGIQLLHTHSYKPNLYGRLAGNLFRSAGMRMVAHYHNTYDNKWAEDDSLIYEELLARSTDGFIACSGSVRDHIVDRVGVEAERIKVIYNGIDPDRFRPREDRASLRQALGISPHETAVGLIGRICRQKAQDDLLRAAAHLRERCPNAVFLLAGAPDEADYLDTLKTLSLELGVADRVRFLGYVSDIPRIFGALDILAMPSRWEGFGLALAEAMAMGVPIVTTPVGGIPEVVGESGAAIMVDPNQPAQLAAAIASLIADPGRASAMSRAGLKRSRKFSHAQTGMDVDALYRELLMKAPT